MACVNVWARPIESSALLLGPSLLCALPPHWPPCHFSPIQKTNFHSPSCLTLHQIHTQKQIPRHPDRGFTPSLGCSVHFLSAGQHCLLQEGEYQEDARPLPPLPLREVVGHHVIWEKNARFKKMLKIPNRLGPWWCRSKCLFYCNLYPKDEHK